MDAGHGGETDKARIRGGDLDISRMAAVVVQADMLAYPAAL